MSGNQRYYPDGSNVNQYHLSNTERHSEGYELGEAINAFLELKATDNDYVAALMRIIDEFDLDYDGKLDLLILALEVADFEDEPVYKTPDIEDELPASVDWSRKNTNLRQTVFRMRQRFDRFQSDDNRLAAD